MRQVGPRRLALEVLLAVGDGAASDRALDRALERHRQDDRDRRLATELVYGVLRRRRSLDEEAARHCHRPLGGLDDEVREGLRLGLYQLRHLDQVPDHAAVDTTVAAVKRRRPQASGFVNGVLRSALRAGPPEDPGWAVRHEAPDWWAERMVERHGREAASAWLAATLDPPPLVIRPRPGLAAEELARRLDEEDVGLEESPWIDGAFRVVAGRPTASRALAAGDFVFRGEAGQLVTECLPVAEGPVLDACCGRGGKSLQLAERVGGGLYATEIAAWRAARCLEATRAAGMPARVVVADLTRGLPLDRSFGSILLDAPCSGLGTVRGRPEIKWRVDEKTLERLAALQRTLLRRALDALRPGGRLLYVTCSTEPEENEEVVEAVVGELPWVVREPVRPPASAPASVGALIGADGYLRTFPAAPDLDGFFAAALRRREERPGTVG